MNYRTMVKGALALSLSLIVGSSWAEQTAYNDVQKYGATFESTANTTVGQLNDYAYALGSGITNQLYRDEQAAKGWFPGSEEDESKIVARTDAAGGQALQLNTDASTLTNKLDATKAGEINAAITVDSSAFFETEVKFVASDTPDAGITGGTDATKFAIYAYCDEEAETVTTNLVVYHAYVDGNGDIDYTNEVFKSVNIDTEVYTKLRIEMKKMDAGTDGLMNVFSVKVGNGEPISSKVAFDAYLSEAINDDGIWFLTVEDIEGDLDNTKVASLNFKGTGEIDNISVGVVESTTTYAIDWTGSANVVVSNATGEVTGTSGDFETGVVLTFYPTEGLITNANDVALDPAAASWTFTVAEADATFTVFAGEEVQPLDDNWTIVGLNPRGEWTDPTAVAADSKTLFYSNLVVNIDPIDATEGRSIVAAWIGARVVAPEAVTSANASQWTIGIGNATYTFDQVKESEGNFFNLWVPVTAAKVRTAIATHSDIVYTVEAYTDPSAKQILSMVINPMNIEITNTGDVEGGDTIDVDDWTEVVNATIISVAKLSATGAMVDDAAPTLTATVTDENGDAVAAADYTIDASAIDMTTAGLYPVIITATGAGYAGTLTNYYAVMNLTWFNGTPTQKALINPQNMTLTGAHYMHTTQDGAYLALGASNGNGTGWGHALYSVATLTSIYGTCQGVWEVAHFTNGGGKGMTANTTSGIMLNGGGNVGGTVATQSTFKGYDIGDLANIGTSSNMVQETYTAEWDGSGYAAGQIMDGIDFNHAGTKVFGNNAGTDGPWVYQLAIDKAAKTMTWEATYTTDFARIRSVSSYYIDGKDYVFVGEGASSGHGEIAVIDPSNGSITTICAAADDFTTTEFPSGRYFTNVKVSGIASGEMYLYGCTDKGEVVVWALGHDAATGAWKTAPVGNITSAEAAALNSKASVGNCRAFEVSDDNTAGFLYVQSSPGQFAVVTDISLAQRKALASATLTPAGSDKDVALGAITATVLDENGDTVAASEYTITTNLIDIATAGEYTVTITPVEGSVYSNAVTAVYTISEPAAGYNYPEGGAIEDADVVAWLTTKGFTQAQVTALTTNAKLNECYLLNCDISQAGAGGSIAISAITVTGSSVTVTVELDRTAGIAGGINGTLKLYGADDLADEFEELDAATVTDEDFSEGDTTTATLSGGTAKFFRAVVE